jgi:hypothetical protein
VAPLLLQQGCSEAKEGTSEKIFREKVQPMFEERCSPSCHEPDGFNGKLFLGEEYGSERLVHAPSSQVTMDLIDPGNLEGSYLWHKLQNTHRDVGGEGSAMPYASWPLPDEELALIEEYILALGD